MVFTQVFTYLHPFLSKMTELLFTNLLSVFKKGENLTSIHQHPRDLVVGFWAGSEGLYGTLSDPRILSDPEFNYICKNPLVIPTISRIAPLVIPLHKMAYISPENADSVYGQMILRGIYLSVFFVNLCGNGSLLFKFLLSKYFPKTHCPPNFPRK